MYGTFDRVLISDCDIRAEIDSQRIVLEPFDPAMVQPSSVDVRIDRLFRLFDNHKYAHIDPAEDQPELTRLVEVLPVNRSSCTRGSSSWAPPMRP